MIRRPRATIHVLDDDSLLNFSRPTIFLQLGDWGDERWWYKLVQVCQRWRYLILGSAAHLDLSLLCTDTVAHSPPLPHEDRNMTAEDEEGMQHRDRIRRIYLRLPIPSLQKLITTMLEFMYCIWHLRRSIIPREAPQLRHLWLSRSFFGGSTHPHTLTQTICFDHFLLPRLEMHTPITIHITIIVLSNLRRFHFRGISAYLDSLLPQIITPRLKSLRVQFYHEAVAVWVYRHVEDASDNFYLEVACKHLDWQVSSLAQIFHFLRPLFPVKNDSIRVELCRIVSKKISTYLIKIR
jgi:hypothetical protein